MHKRLNWQDSLANIIKIIIAIWLFKELISYLFPVLLLSYGDKYRKNLYIYLINNSSYIFSSYEQDDDEKINSTSVLIKQITGIDINDPKSLLTLEVPLINQIDKQILLAREDGPVIVIPKIQEEEESSDEEEIKPKDSNDSDNEISN
ncbi:MAG: hypothetical protein N2486_11155, partial [Caloramator sp.]|nr:hypothetical protein [Caloramator sp.]